MPRYATHAFLGAAAGTIYSYKIQRRRLFKNQTDKIVINPIHVGICSYAGFIGGCFPDKAEPANKLTGPNHRGAVHSLFVVAITMKCMSYCANFESSNEILQWLVDSVGACCAGILSHLGADSFTPNGLNIFRKGM